MFKANKLLSSPQMVVLAVLIVACLVTIYTSLEVALVSLTSLATLISLGYTIRTLFYLRELKNLRKDVSSETKRF